MKNLLAAIFCLLALRAASQGKTQTRELRVYGRDGKTVIAKVLIDASLKSNLLVISSVQNKDPFNNYLTTFYLGNKDAGPLTGMRILLRFSKAVSSVTPHFTTAFNNVNGLSEDHKTYIFKAGRLERDPGSPIVLSFMIKSSDRVVTEISGADGVLQ